MAAPAIVNFYNKSRDIVKIFDGQNNWKQNLNPGEPWEQVHTFVGDEWFVHLNDGQGPVKTYTVPAESNIQWEIFDS